MRHEHTDPDDAALAHLDLGSTRSFGVQWGRFQLGDAEPFQAARDLDLAVRQRGVTSFGLLPIGAVLDIDTTFAMTGSPWRQPAAMLPVPATSKAAISY